MIKKIKDYFWYIKYFYKELYFFKALFSPFKPFKLDFYFGDIEKGVPYFLPRKVNKKTNKFEQTKWFGINYCFLGYKTKWTNDDFRFEWKPRFSIVLLKKQFCITVVVENPYHYWESFLYYEKRTDKKLSKEERIKLTIKYFPQTYTVTSTKDGKYVVNYYELILKEKYLKFIDYENKI